MATPTKNNADISVVANYVAAAHKKIKSMEAKENAKRTEDYYKIREVRLALDQVVMDLKVQFGINI